jgi:hypothetical protein
MLGLREIAPRKLSSTVNQRGSVSGTPYSVSMPRALLVLNHWRNGCTRSAPIVGYAPPAS